ncbi:hypothetical protein XF30_10355 [Bradyrhizobium sp. SUTN9-2]|nr:hypothetical protein XF30_10355 [Bradyrhizobium sp. SUTN9-2]
MLKRLAFEKLTKDEEGDKHAAAPATSDAIISEPSLIPLGLAIGARVCVVHCVHLAVKPVWRSR